MRRRPEPDAKGPEGDAGVRISIVLSETEAVGGFAGGSFAEPVLNAGILLSVFGYMLYVQPWMALVALLMLSPQLLFIPTLQEAINRRTAAPDRDAARAQRRDRREAAGSGTHPRTTRIGAGSATSTC